MENPSLTEKFDHYYLALKHPLTQVSVQIYGVRSYSDNDF